MYQLIFLSQWDSQPMTADLDPVLETSRTRDSSGDVSSMFVHWDGNVVGILEGSLEGVERAFEGISRDARYAEVEVIAYGIIPFRRFSIDGPGLVDLDPRDPAREDFVSRHPHLAQTPDCYRDPMLAFALLYDAARSTPHALAPLEASAT